MKFLNNIKYQRENRIKYLIEKEISLTEICLDCEIQELFHNVKDIRDRIRKIMNKKGYSVYKGYLIEKSKVDNFSNTELKTFDELRLKKSEIRILKKIIGHYNQIKLLLKDNACHLESQNLSFCEAEEKVIAELICQNDNLLSNQKTKTIKSYEIPIINYKNINTTIRINKAIFDEFWEFISRDYYLSTLKKTDIFNIVFYEAIKKLK